MTAVAFTWIKSQKETEYSRTFQDRNDIPPVFLTVPRPITLDDNVAINTLVTTVAATDSDGTAPGNKVKPLFIILGLYIFNYSIDHKMQFSF